MSDALQFGSDGYLDLSAYPDTDPDALDAGTQAAVHDAVVSPDAAPDVDEGAWDGMVAGATSGEADIDVSDVDVPGADDGPFDVTGWDDTGDDTAESDAEPADADPTDDASASIGDDDADDDGADLFGTEDDTFVDDGTTTTFEVDDYGTIEDHDLGGNEDGLSPEDDDGIIDF